MKKVYGKNMRTCDAAVEHRFFCFCDYQFLMKTKIAYHQ